MKPFLAIPAIAFVSMVTLSSCFSPKPVIRVKPEETNTTWEKGKEFVSYRKGGFEVYAAYEGSNSKYLIFDIEVVNGSEESLLIAPENYLLFFGNWENNKQQIVYNAKPIKAIDPEVELLNIDLARSRAEAARKNAQVLSIVTAVAAVPLLVAASVSEANTASYSENELKISNTETVAAGLDFTIGTANLTAIDQENQIISLNDAHYAWEEAALRKTTLSAGYSIRGFVYFPLPTLSARNLKLSIPLVDDVITVDYKLLLHYPQNQP